MLIWLFERFLYISKSDFIIQGWKLRFMNKAEIFSAGRTQTFEGEIIVPLYILVARYKSGILVNFDRKPGVCMIIKYVVGKIMKGYNRGNQPK